VISNDISAPTSEGFEEWELTELTIDDKTTRDLCRIAFKAGQASRNIRLPERMYGKPPLLFHVKGCDYENGFNDCREQVIAMNKEVEK